jgi:hypothetical protein
MQICWLLPIPAKQPKFLQRELRIAMTAGQSGLALLSGPLARLLNRPHVILRTETFQQHYNTKGLALAKSGGMAYLGLPNGVFEINPFFRSVSQKQRCLISILSAVACLRQSRAGDTD